MSNGIPASIQRGLTFEAFTVGGTMVSPARTITEHDVCAFAGLSGDYNPLHTDAEFARETPFGQRIAHGLLGLSVASGLAARLGFLDGTALAFRGLEWRFRKPILLGDTIRTEVKVASKRAMPAAAGGGIIQFEVRVVNQADEVVQKGTWDVLVRGGDSPGGGDATA